MFFKNLKKNLYRNSVQSLFLKGDFALNSERESAGIGYDARAEFKEISGWSNFYKINLSQYQPMSLRITNQAFADRLNRYEAAALIICHFINIDHDEEGDCLQEEDKSEYSKIYSLFINPPYYLYQAFQVLKDSGDLSSNISLTIEDAFSILFKKYPEFKNPKPEEPKSITWWELVYNDSESNKHRIIKNISKAVEVVDYISFKEGTKDLFWDYPSAAKYREWEPTMPPTKEFDKNSIFAIPRRGWITLWEKYEGIGFDANFDHWEALKKEAQVRPKDADFLLHKKLKKPYQERLL